MGYITGANAIAGVKAAGTFGTATTIATNDKLVGFTIAQSENAEALKVSPIGSGNSMLSSSDIGNSAPSVSISGPLGYNSPELAAIAQMFGTENVMTMGSGAYMHSVLFNETANSMFTTVAFQGHSATAGAMEFPSCSTTKVSLSYPEPANYITAAIDMLANEQKISSTTNTYATLNSATVANLKKVVWEASDEFLINAQAGGALSNSTDLVSISSATVDFQRPQEVSREAKGSSGNGTPVASGDYPFVATVQVKFRNLTDWTYFTAAKAGTEYKLSLVKTGSLIGGSQYYKFGVYFPRVKILTSPDWSLQSPASNPLTVTFEAMVAGSNPTGMIHTKPYLIWCNDRSTAHIA